MDSQILLHVNEIAQKYDLLNEKTGGNFNIFNITDISNDEKKICLVLYELLSPTGCHNQKELYLKLFAENVLEIQMSVSELRSAQVYREFVIDENRRIDLVIDTKERFIPIEVKIFATDQPRQCYDYYQESKKYVTEPILYYLTRFGSDPDGLSAEGLTKTAEGYSEIKKISFEKDILSWLDLCIKDMNTLQIAPIREILLQFMSVIRQFTNQMEEDMESEVIELLLSSSVNMKSAIVIEKSLQEAKEAFMKKLFEAIEAHVDRKKLCNEYDYAYNDFELIRGFYKHKTKSTEPGISYHCKSNVKKDVDIWVRIAVEGNYLYVGYCCPVNEKKTKEQTLSENEILYLLKVEPEIDRWWAYSEYCSIDNESDYPDFLSYNTQYLNLFDNVHFEQFVEKCAKRVRELLNL